MNEMTRIVIDTSKSVFTLHGTDANGSSVLRRNLRRHDMAPFFARRPPMEVVLEACGGSHQWGRVLAGLGHTVRVIPSQYVKPFVKRGKNDRNDAEAISEAAARPEMCEVTVKSADQQAKAMPLSVRELLVRQRTQLVNALRGHAAEFGHVSRLGRESVAKVLADVAEDAEVPTPAKDALALLGREIGRLDARIGALNVKLFKGTCLTIIGIEGYAKPGRDRRAPPRLAGSSRPCPSATVPHPRSPRGGRGLAPGRS